VDSDASYNVASGSVEDVIYVGSHTRFRVRVHETRLSILQQQNRFLDQDKPITRNDKVWVRWHSHDGFVIGA
jgi:ABC-type Fe3+/spermidine/putrescine transport system ATPase subunit